MLLVLLILSMKSPYDTPQSFPVQFRANNVISMRTLPIYPVTLSRKQYGLVKNVKIVTPVTGIQSIHDTLTGCANACNSNTGCIGFTRIQTNGPNQPSTCTLFQGYSQVPVFTTDTTMDIYGKITQG